ncbi:unnamed protein product [Haemonchus placei]|uniref:Uncharacterized protein n=1 Tax=Haemonchus placei TaxID=6290 RepID=A0A0N4VX57_HAEPC|nr:unnamed protein product [Haemonchus placei]
MPLGIVEMNQTCDGLLINLRFMPLRIIQVLILVNRRARRILQKS